MSLICTHNSGFFSCCSVKLTYIVNYINKFNKIPEYVDSSKQFQLYKKDNVDVTYIYFEHYDNLKDIIINYPINFHWDFQFIDYSKLDYKFIIPVVKKFFSPSFQILKTVEDLKNKYNIDYNNTIAVYYRGTDKYNETQIADFDIFYDKLQTISNLSDNINKQIIIQTDTAPFIDYILHKNLKNIIIFNENQTSYLNKGIHYEKTTEENANDMLYLFSIFLIISKCKYIICGSGNVAIWIMFYREHTNNVFQFLNGIWYNNNNNNIYIYYNINMESYSQISQDLEVLKIYQNKKNGYFVEIGANDGILLSNTYLLEKNYEWKGICIEALPDKISILKQNRPNSYIINKAVYINSGSYIPFTISNNNDLYSGITDNLTTHIETINKNSSIIDVETITLNQALQEGNAPLFIDYLSLDTEGTELQILLSVDLKKYIFGLIDVEHNFVEPRRSQIKDLLLKNGYIYKGQNQFDDSYFHSSLLENSLINLNHKTYKPFTIFYKILNNDFIKLKEKLLNLILYFDFSNVGNLNFYIHNIYFSDFHNLINSIELKKYVNVNIDFLHYNYHGYLKQMVSFGTSFINCNSKFIVLLDDNFDLNKNFNLYSKINNNEKIDWNYSKKEDDINTFNIWQKATEDSIKDTKKFHFSSNGTPFIFTKSSLHEAHDKFLDLHHCDYEGYCINRCGHFNIKVDDPIHQPIFNIFNEIEYIGNYCYYNTNDYNFIPRENPKSEIKNFTIVYKTYQKDLQWIEYSLKSLIKFLDYSNIYELIIYSHDVVYNDIIIMLEKINMNLYCKNKVLPVHYNYHGYVKQMEVKANCFKDCNSKYIVLLDSDLLLKRHLNLENLLLENGKIEWKYLKKEDDPHNSVFSVWNRAFEDSNKCPKNVHYMSNGFPFIFTKDSLFAAANKFIEMHQCDYEAYCINRCGHLNIKVEDSTTSIFDRLSKVFTEFEYLGYFCHHFSNDYIFNSTPYCKMDAQFQKSNNDSYFIQNWSHGGIDQNTSNIINQILNG